MTIATARSSVTHDYRHRTPEGLECDNPHSHGILGYIAYLERYRLSLLLRPD